MDNSLIDYSDVQGLVRFGHGHLPKACFLLLRVEDPAAARAWLGSAPVTTAEKLPNRPDTAIQIALTCEGLDALGVPQGIIQRFPLEFTVGLAGDESRSRRLGDIGSNAPVQWAWGSQSQSPHLLLMLYAHKGKVLEWADSMIEKLSAMGFSLLKRLDTTEVDGFEPFGFRDNISQPQPDWNLEYKSNEKIQLTYSNQVALGEFLLGYPNEYGQFTDRPVIDAPVGQSTPLLPALDQPGKLDLGRNGTYLVFRHLEQDVRGFWQFLDRQANADSSVREALAQALVGRTRDGVPLVANADISTPPTKSARGDSKHNDFTFDQDSAGIRCPLGAHIRRSNPRTSDFPAGTGGLISRLLRTLGFCRDSFRSDAIASARFHRLLRRGRKYGKNLTPEQAIETQGENGEEHGIYFICLNANIVRQFEFVQNAWLMGAKFDGLSDEDDPLIGNRVSVGSRDSANSFTMPQPETAPRRLNGIPQFVTVRGGAYFFLPSIRVLRYLTQSSGRMRS